MIQDCYRKQYDNNDWDNAEVNKTDGRSLYCWFVKSSGVSLSQRVRAAFCIIAILHSLQSTAPWPHRKILINNNQILRKYFTKNPPDRQCIIKPAITLFLVMWLQLQYYNITILQYYMLQEMPMNEVKAYSSRGSRWGQSSQPTVSSPGLILCDQCEPLQTEN